MVRLLALAVILLASLPAVAQDGIDLNHTEKEMIAQLNAFRASNGLPALRPAGWLMSRARQHTQWMVENHSMTHSLGIAENIAMGQGSVSAVMRAWIGSSGHNNNMRGGHVYCGVAGYTSPNGTPFWCQQFSGSATGSPVAIEGGGGSGRPITAPVKRFFRLFRR